MGDNMSNFSIPRLSEQVAEQIISYIQANQLKEGTKLPTERKLSELLETSRSSIREGLRILEILGYIESKQGYGTIVAKTPPFIIPKQIIRENVSTDELYYYFDIAIMVAEKMMTLVNASPNEIHQKDWRSFSNYVQSIAKMIKNPYYYSLWYDTCRFLHDHDFFEKEADYVEKVITQLIK